MQHILGVVCDIFVFRTQETITPESWAAWLEETTVRDNHVEKETQQLWWFLPDVQLIIFLLSCSYTL